MSLNRSLVLAAAVIALAGCKKTPELRSGMTPAPATAAASSGVAAADAETAVINGFHHQPGVDTFGYYSPTTDVAAGDLKLAHLSLGGEDEFRNWEGGRRMSTYSPVMFEFDDTTSRKVKNELGGFAYARTIRVLPQAYDSTGDRVRFLGTDKRLGEITFDGKFDTKAMSEVKGGSGPITTAVLNGKLTVGGKTYDNVSFTWFGGD